MTYREMFKKVDAYNEVAKAMGANEAELRCRIGIGFSEGFKDAKTFRKFINTTFIPELAEMILAYGEYEFNTEATILFTDRFGYKMQEEIEFFPY